MARVTVEDCLEKVVNRFELVLLASKRARDLAMNGVEPKVETDKPHKSTVLALYEIAAGYGEEFANQYRQKNKKTQQHVDNVEH